MDGDTIRKIVGVVSAIIGLVCFGLSFTYKISFGKFGTKGLCVYLLISPIMLFLIYFFGRIRLTGKFKTLVETILFGSFCLISIKFHELMPGKSDALSIISFGLLALASLCASRESELGFDSGFCAFFLALFFEQSFKTDWKLLPMGLTLCGVVFHLRHRSQSANPNGDPPQEQVPAPATDRDLEMGQVSGENVSSTNDQQNNPEQSSQAAYHPPSNNGGVSEESTSEDNRWSFTRTRRHSPSNYGQVSEENISDRSSEQNNEEEEDSTSTSTAKRSNSSEQVHVPPADPPQQFIQRWTAQQDHSPNLDSVSEDTDVVEWGKMGSAQSEEGSNPGGYNPKTTSATDMHSSSVGDICFRDSPRRLPLLLKRARTEEISLRGALARKCLPLKPLLPRPLVNVK